MDQALLLKILSGKEARLDIPLLTLAFLFVYIEEVKRIIIHSCFVLAHLLVLHLFLIGVTFMYLEMFTKVIFLPTLKG